MFKKYSKKVFKNLRNQHNILVPVGNGFDISALKNYGKGDFIGKTTTCSDFFDYITYFNLADEKNILYSKMKENKQRDKENWSNFECLIEELYITNSFKVETLENSLDEFQDYFNKFLNDLVNSDTLLELNKKVKENDLSSQSLTKFLNDVKNLTDFKYLAKFDHYDLLKFTFLNFNYTSLLDNYIYLDKSQFDPHKYKYADRNVSTYVLSEVIHPHGVQAIPRSILFGIDIENFDHGISEEKRLVKSYWGQYNVKYNSYIDDATLFIVYGMSLGKSDAWWIDEIFDAVIKRNCELIIYMYGNKDDDEVKEIFLNSCVRHKKLSSYDNDKEKVKRNIHVVSFIKNDTYF